MRSVISRKLPVVSVIVTCYNQELTIRETINSILLQRCDFEFEIIVADDGSTDSSRSICQTFLEMHPDKIKAIFQVENLGVGANWCLAVMQANGKYICTCAADDFWHNPDKLHLQVNYMKTHADCGLLYTDYNVLDSNSKKSISNFLTKKGMICASGPGLMQQIFSGKVPILTVTTCLRKDLFDKYIPSADYIKFKFPLEDWPTWLILAKYTTIGYLPVSTATYRKGHDSISNPLQFIKAEKKFEREYEMYKYLCDRFQDDLIFDEKAYRIYSNTNLLSLAFNKISYSSAKKYSRNLVNDDYNSIKVKCASNKLFFYFFIFIKLLRFRDLTSYSVKVFGK